MSRQSGGGRWDSERQLRAWLGDDGCSYSARDLSPAMAMLEAMNRIGRDAASATSPRAGWLITAAQKPVWSSGKTDGTEPADEPDEAPEEAAPVLAGAVIRALSAGNGRLARVENQDELLERLEEDGVDIDLDLLPDALALLMDPEGFEGTA